MRVLLFVLALLLVGLVPGCYGIEIIADRSAIDRYEDAIVPILDEWKSVVDDWEEAANDSGRSLFWDVDAETAYSRMRELIASWNAIVVPEEVKEYHLFMGHAMEYEREAFRIMAEYYQLGEDADPEEFDRLRNLAVELWVLKDQALFNAMDAYPNR